MSNSWIPRKKFESEEGLYVKDDIIWHNSTYLCDKSTLILLGWFTIRHFYIIAINMNSDRNSSGLLLWMWIPEVDLDRDHGESPEWMSQVDPSYNQQSMQGESPMIGS